MMIFTIGENAGLVWQMLDEQHEMSLAQLKSRLGLNDAALWAAIGWLAREGQIYCRAVDEELWFSNSLSDGFITFG